MFFLLQENSPSLRYMGEKQMMKRTGQKQESVEESPNISK